MKQTHSSSSLFKAVILSAAMLAFGSASAAETETCQSQIAPGSLGMRVALEHSPEFGEYIQCSAIGGMPGEKTLYKGEHFTITPVEKTGWDISTNFGSNYVAICKIPNGSTNTCEFTVERNSEVGVAAGSSSNSFKNNQDDLSDPNNGLEDQKRYAEASAKCSAMKALNPSLDVKRCIRSLI